jgi:uncharacterized membrane protein YcaP (DUF421 family)
VLLAANYVGVRSGFRHPKVARALQGTPTVLVEHGQVQEPGLRRYLITREELAAAVRRQGARDLTDVDTVILEANGTLTVERRDHMDDILRRLGRIEAKLDR